MGGVTGVFAEEVGAVWWLAVGTVKGEGAVDFVGGDVVESALCDRFFATLRMTREELRMTRPAERLPAEAGGLKEGKGSHYIGLGECEWVFDRAIYVRFCREVDDAVDIFVFHQTADGLEVADVQFYELVVRFILDIAEICKITGIGEFIDIYNAIVRVLVYQQSDYVAAYESGSAGYEDGSVHYNKLRRYWPYWFLDIG